MEQNIIRWVNENCIWLDYGFTIIKKYRKLAYYDESDYLESEFYREENIENSTVNNFISPSSSSILPENNEVMPVSKQVLIFLINMVYTV